MLILIFSILTLLLVFMTITTAFQNIFGIPFALLFKSSHAAWFFGSVITWSLIQLLWVTVVGRPMPLIVLILGFGYLLYLQNAKGKGLTENSITAMAAEQWAIVVVAIFSPSITGQFSFF